MFSEEYEAIESPSYDGTLVVDRASLQQQFKLDPLSLKSDSDNPRVMSVAEVANLIGKSTRTVQKLLKKGILKGRKIDGPKGPQWQVDASSFKEVSMRDSQALFEQLEASVQVLGDAQERLSDLQLEMSVQLEQLTAEFRQEISYIETQMASIHTQIDRMSKVLEQQNQILCQGDAESSWWSKLFRN